MAGCGLARLITSELARRLVLEVGKWRRAAVYPSADLTTAQALVLGLYHSLLEGDDAAAHLLLGAASGLPELASPSLAVWLRGDPGRSGGGGVQAGGLPGGRATDQDLWRRTAGEAAATTAHLSRRGAPRLNAFAGRGNDPQEQCVEVRPRVRSVSTQTAIEAIDEVSAEPSACEVAPELLVASAAKSTKHQVLSAPPFPDQAPGETAVEASARATDENVPAFQGRRAAASGRSSTPATKFVARSNRLRKCWKDLVGRVLRSILKHLQELLLSKLTNTGTKQMSDGFASLFSSIAGVLGHLCNSSV